MVHVKHRKDNSWLPLIPRSALTLGVASLFLIAGATACNAATTQNAFDPATGQFVACPDSPNCVSTQTPGDDKEHAIAPLSYTGSAIAAKERLITVMNEMPRTTVITDEAVEGGHYLHVEFRSFLFRFVDDVEFFINETTNSIDFRSASRVGYSDLGVNRKRMEEIRTKFQAQP